MNAEPHWVKDKDSKDPTLTDMQAFYRSVDWAEWWDLWYLKHDKSGRPFFRSIYQFARAQSKNRRQYEFIIWFIGPSTDPLTGKAPVPYDEKFSFVQPQDWPHVRRTGGWHTEKQTKEFSHKLAAERDALEAMREAGQVIVVPALKRYERMAEAWDRMMNYGEADPALTARQNEKRFELWVAVHEQIEKLKARALDWFFKSRGVNLEQPASFTEMVQIQALIAQRSGEQKISKRDLLLKQITEMTLAKHAEYGIALPKEMQQKILDVAVQPDDDKEKVQ